MEHHLMSTAPIIHYAGGANLELAHQSRAGVLARAPAWVRQLSQAKQPAMARPKASAPVASRSSSGAGWVWGLAVCGISEPCRSASDSEHLPEMFRTDALERLAQQINSGDGSVRLLWGHGGPEICRNSRLDLVARQVDVHQHPSLSFQARLRESPAVQQAVRLMGQDLVGVSVEFDSPRSYQTELRGHGRVRVVTSARLLAIALVPKGSGMRAAYSACTAMGRQGDHVGCSPAMRDAVRHRAWRELLEQARRMA
jgi:hypothetical protein